MNFGIGPFCKQVLMEEVKKSSYYVLSFDECMNKVTQTSEMDVLVRYFDESLKQVKTRYLTSSFLGHSKHTDLLWEFNKSSENIDERRLIQISMDGPSVSWKSLESVQLSRNKDEYPQLINIGS